MKTFRFIGSTTENRNTILMLGKALGCQHSRKMTIGDTIAANANDGNVRAIEACEAHPELFETISEKQMSNTENLITQVRAILPTKPKSNNQIFRTMEQITIAVRANRDIIEDTDVNVKVDATTSIWRNEITIWFDNGDYCDINIRTFHQTGRYLTTYLNVYAVDAFIDKLKKMV